MVTDEISIKLVIGVDLELLENGDHDCWWCSIEGTGYSQLQWFETRDEAYAFGLEKMEKWRHLEDTDEEEQ